MLLKILTFTLVLSQSVRAFDGSFYEHSIEFRDTGSSLTKVVDLDVHIGRLLGHIEAVDSDTIDVESLEVASDPWMLGADDEGRWDYWIRVPLRMDFFLTDIPYKNVVCFLEITSKRLSSATEQLRRVAVELTFGKCREGEISFNIRFTEKREFYYTGEWTGDEALEIGLGGIVYVSERILPPRTIVPLWVRK